MIIVSGGGPVSAFPSYFSSGKCSVVTVSPRPSQQALSMREGVVPGTLVDIPFTHLPKHIFVNGELKSSLAVDESWKPAVHESKKNCRATGLRVIAVNFPASDVLSKHNLPIIEMHCNQSFVMAAGVCLSLGVTGLSVSQAEQACVGARVALSCGVPGNTGVVTDASTMQRWNRLATQPATLACGRPLLGWPVSARLYSLG